MRFDPYQPEDVLADDRTRMVYFTDLHDYGRNSNEAGDLAKRADLIAREYGADTIKSLGDFGSLESLEIFLEELDEFEEFICIEGDEDRSPKGFNPGDIGEDEYGMDVEIVRGAHIERVEGWDVADGHFPNSSYDEAIQEEFDVNWWADSLAAINQYVTFESGGARIDFNDFDVINYGHAHLNYTRPVLHELWNCPGSPSTVYNGNASSPMPDRNIQMISFGEEEIDVLNFDYETMEIWEHRKFSRRPDGFFNMEEVVGENVGIERINPDKLDRMGVNIEEREEFGIMKALREKHKEFMGDYGDLDGSGTDE